MSMHIVACHMNGVTTAKFEIEPTKGFRPTPWQVRGQGHDAVDRAVKAAKAALDKVKETRPSQVEVSVGSDRLAAKATAEGSPEVPLRWACDVGVTGAGTV